MKPSDGRYTAWVDGLLSGKELADFEAELAQDPEFSMAQAEQDRDAAQRLGKLLRSYADASTLKNEDFFNHQILQQIEAGRQHPAARHSRPLPLWRLIWAGLSCMGIATLMYFTMVRPQLDTKGPPPEYYAQILNAKGGDPTISAVAYHDKKHDITVLWLDGLAYMPKQPGK